MVAIVDWRDVVAFGQEAEKKMDNKQKVPRPVARKVISPYEEQTACTRPLCREAEHNSELYTYRVSLGVPVL